MNCEVLFNFISPVTGRILCDPTMVLVGDARGIAIPSSFIPFEALPNLTLNHFWVGDANNRPVETPVTAFLPPLPFKNLWIGNNANQATAVANIEINNLPNLTENTIWIGDAMTRPVERLVDYVSGPTPPVAVSNNVPVWDGYSARLLKDSFVSIDTLTAGATEAAASAAAAAKSAKLAALFAAIALGAAIASVVAAVEANKDPVAGPPGAAGSAGKPTLVFNANLDLSGGRIEDLAPSPLADYDAVNAKWVWDLLNDNVEIIFEER